MLAAIERYRVTVLAAVSTQFVMLLNSPALDAHDLSSLRVMFTGGEMVPYERAREFEERTGATVLQFYGSNETGALSATTLDDPPELRLRTAGRVIPEMHVRLLDPDTDADITATGGPGVPAGKGPTLCLGYWDDDAANERLFTADGWMRMGDLATIDADGYLTVVGRTSDVIIRGGKNISAAQVEDEVGVASRGRAVRARSRCPTRRSASASACSSSSAPATTTLTLDDAQRAPRGARHRQGALARTARGARRAPPLVGRQARQGRARRDRPQSLTRRQPDASAAALMLAIVLLIALHEHLEPAFEVRGRALDVDHRRVERLGERRAVGAGRELEPPTVRRRPRRAAPRTRRPGPVRSR